jgi:uncharacterized membrane protein YdjX (TVP38/TMEM64 family)
MRRAVRNPRRTTRPAEERVAVESLWMLCGWLFLDGATFGVATTPLLLFASQRFEPWQVALAGAVASAAGGALQMLALRALLASDRPWMRRFLPTREALEAARRRYPSTSFAAIAIARATPLPDAPIKLVAAAAGYSLMLYFLAVLLGAIPYYWALAWIGHRFRLPLWAIGAVAAVIVLAFIADQVRRGRDRGANRQDA